MARSETGHNTPTQSETGQDAGLPYHLRFPDELGFELLMLVRCVTHSEITSWRRVAMADGKLCVIGMTATGRIGSDRQIMLLGSSLQSCEGFVTLASEICTPYSTHCSGWRSFL